MIAKFRTPVVTFIYLFLVFQKIIFSYVQLYILETVLDFLKYYNIKKNK